MKPRKKLLVEFITALLIAVASDIRFTNFHGFLGINTLPVWISILVTVLLIVVIMNSFNLIDGIDGLAASIGTLSSIVYAIWFWLAGDMGYAVLATALAGALCAFLPFNLYKGRFKIFMGDAGSLTIGLLLAILTIRFNELNAIGTTPLRFHSAPAVSIGILLLPLFDTLRVTIIRISQRRHPFSGDNNHLHHRLLRLGFTHGKATALLVIVNALFIVLAIFLDNIGVMASCLIMLLSATMLSLYSLKLEKNYILRKIGSNVKNTDEIHHLNPSVLKHNKMINMKRALVEEYEATS
jgi:UDP-N-acetylmuramyl pentapeptide phosphotransferase/UDP-N-acetylglucosamine-1-phosphate transferase